MKAKKSRSYYVLAATGLMLFVVGVVLAAIYDGHEGIMQTLPFVFIGVGCGFMGGGFGGAFAAGKAKKNPALAKQMEIEAKDERNISIANKAKAVAFNWTLIILSALIVFMAVMQAGRPIIFVAIGAYFLIVSVFVFFLSKYQKEM